MAQVNPFRMASPSALNPSSSPSLTPSTLPYSAVTEVTLDDDTTIPVRSKYSALTEHHRALLKAWVGSTQLDADQREVVTAPTEGIHKVLANAGSGKTHTLIARAIYILATTEVDPRHMALLTFTNRAAREIKERFRKVLADVTGMTSLPIPYIGTIHGFAYNLIAAAEGHSQTIMTEGAGRSLLRRLLKTELFPEDKEKHHEALVRRLHATYNEICANNELHLFAWPVWVNGAPSIYTPRDARWDASSLATLKYVDQTARSVTAALTSMAPEYIGDSILPMDSNLKRDVRAHYAGKAGVSESELITILKHFVAAKYATRSFEFVDLLYYPVAYFSQHPAALQRQQQRLRYIFQDEAQDQDTLQYALLRLMAGPTPNLLFCADTKQTLYFWRQARPDLTDGLDRVNKPVLFLPGDTASPSQKVTPHYLRTNYRSKKQLVEIANYFASGFKTKAATPAIPFHPAGAKTVSVKFYDTSVSENKGIAEDIARLMREAAGGRKFADFAVLTHTNRALLDLEAAFIAQRIPYHLKHDNRSTTKQSTFRVMAAFYALALNPRDVSALCEVLEPIKGLGDKFLVKLQTRLTAIFAAKATLTIDTLSIQQDFPDINPAQHQYRHMQTLLDKLVRPFVKLIRAGQTRVPDLNLELRTLYTEHGWHEGEVKHAASSKTLEWQFTAEALQRVTRTLDQIYLTLQEDQDFQQLSEPEKIAAIHGILALGSDDSSQEDLEDDYIPADKKDRVTLSTGHAFKGKQAPVVFVANLASLAPPKDDPEEEQRCWMYVAITRPQEQLFLSLAEAAPDYKQQMRATHRSIVFDEFLAAIEAWKAKQK